MKLNPECIRDLLLTLEDVTTVEKPFLLNKNNHADYPRLTQYSFDEVHYHIVQCHHSNLIQNFRHLTTFDFSSALSISYLSPKGHEFLENIRSDNMWNNTKSVATKVGSHSLNALTTIATGVLTQVINQQLGLPH